jgi:hypothetical protein
VPGDPQPAEPVSGERDLPLGGEELAGDQVGPLIDADALGTSPAGRRRW